MSTPPLPNPDARPHLDMLADDVVSSFVPKSEDIGVAFPLFNASPPDGLRPSSSHMRGVANAFDPGPSSTVPLSSVSSSVQLDMDVLDSIPSTGPSSAFLSDFPVSQLQLQSSLRSANDDMQGVTPVREESPGSVNTPSSNPSLAASPVPPPFSNVSTSSLASALDESGPSLLNRSRSGSLASPNTNGFASRVSPPRSTHEHSFKFSLPSEYTGIPRPDPVNAPHMLVVDDVLFGIMRAAAYARQACSMGQGVEASSKIDEMKKQIALVSDLMAATMLDTPPSQEIQNGRAFISGMPSPSGVQGHRHSLSMPGLGPPSTPGLIPNFSNVGHAPLSSGPPSLDQAAGGYMSMDISGASGNQGSPDSDTSRKRCASSMAGNRINKALRLDSADGRLPPLTQPATPLPARLNISSVPDQILSTSHPPSLTPSPAALLPGKQVQVPSAPTTSTLSASLGSLAGSLSGASPPSVPSSRPDSPPANLAASQAISWPMMQKHISTSAPVTTRHPALSQTHSSFPLTMPSSAQMPITDPGGCDGELGVGSPTNIRGPWADVPGPAASLSAPLGSGLGTVHPHDLTGPTTMSFEAPPYPPPGHAPLATGPMVSDVGMTAAAMSRASRSSSLSNSLANSHALVYGASSDGVSVSGPPVSVPVQHHTPPEFVPSHGGRARAPSRLSARGPQSPSSSSCDDDGDSDDGGYYGRARGYSFSKASPQIKSRDSSRERPPTRQRLGGSSPGDGQGSSSPGHGNDVPLEYRAEVDRIFFEFLNKVCSNLDATDAKGELIHQTLMAKKMQRLDESPDFRPFKFRIQAFTNGFLEELARQGYSEEKIAMKKVRNYLWTQPYISRFNEDGKKAKSKGNHIWNIDAKKMPEGGWEFRPFHRKLAGSPPSVAYIGLRWTWTPRIWDPQASRANIQVQYSSPNLPAWLSWRDGILQGTPPPDAQSCEVTVEARTVQDGHEELLTQSFLISVSPVPTGTDMSFSGARPSLAADLHNPRRVNSDSIVPNIAGAAARPMQSLPQSMGQVPSLTTQDAQMMQVLTSAAQRVAQEAQAHVIAATYPNEPPGPELQALAKQQHVLTVTAQALDHEVSAPPDVVSPSSHALVAAAQQVVFQAARQVAADRTAVMSFATGISAPQASSAASVTVNEVSVATQTAVAQAVEITGPLSSEVDVMMTASSLLQHHTRPPIMASSAAIESTSLAPTLDAIRPHSTAAPLSGMGPIDF